MINAPLEIEPEDDTPLLEIEPADATPSGAAPGDDASPPAAVAPLPSVPNGGDSVQPPAALMEVLPADFPLPSLIKFVPNPQLRVAADQSAAYALGVEVSGAEGLQRADVALTTLRASLKAIEDHFAEPVEIANKLHKGLTGTRAEWLSRGKQAIETVGRKVYAEQRRLEAIEAEVRRKAQEEADRQAREAARREAEAAAKAKAPAPVVEELNRQAQTATAAPVRTATPAPTMRGTSVVSTWKARIAGTPGSDEPNPDISALTPAQRAQVLVLLKAIIDERAPITAIAIDWSYLNKRAKSDKSTLRIPGIEAFEDGGVRAKGTRSK